MYIPSNELASRFCALRENLQKDRKKIDIEKLNAIHEMEKHIARAVEVAKRYAINRKSVVRA
jgi:hypothetical protein